MLNEPILKKKVKNNKNLGVLAIMLVAITLIGGVYAFFQYSREGEEKTQLITGDVYLHFTDEGNGIKLVNNAFPETKEEARANDRTDNTLTFTIDGKNTTTNKDIWYEIRLMYGDGVTGRTRFNDEHLRFDLVEQIGETKTLLLDAVSYETINNTKIYVDKIESGEETNITYILRMWIDENVLISDTDPNKTYTTGEYKNKFASVKIAVFGDFSEKTADEPMKSLAEYLKSSYVLGTSKGLVAIDTDGSLVDSESDTIREYRYSGNARYCTYTSGDATYTLNVNSDTCPNACLHMNDIIHKTSDCIVNNPDYCETELTPNETIPNEGEVKNYLDFNGEKWRIVGIFNVEKSDGTTEELVKIVKAEPISASLHTGTTYNKITAEGTTEMTLRTTDPRNTGTTTTSNYAYYYWNKSKYFGQKNYNDWTKSALQYYLNDDNGDGTSYYDTISSEAKEMIEEVSWNIGETEFGLTTNDSYSQERAETAYYEGNSATWIGKIGTIYPSDYGYAADSSNWGITMSNYYKYAENTGSQENWYRTNAFNGIEWFMTPSRSNSLYAMDLNFIGIVNNYIVHSHGGVATPSLYLKSSTSITGGDGSYQDSYKVA